MFREKATIKKCFNTNANVVDQEVYKVNIRIDFTNKMMKNYRKKRRSRQSDVIEGLGASLAYHFGIQSIQCFILTIFICVQRAR